MVCRKASPEVSVVDQIQSALGEMPEIGPKLTLPQMQQPLGPRSAAASTGATQVSGEAPLTSCSTL